MLFADFNEQGPHARPREKLLQAKCEGQSSESQQKSEGCSPNRQEAEFCLQPG